MPLHVQGLGIEQAHPRREPLWLIEFDLVDDSLGIKNKNRNVQQSTGLCCLSSPRLFHLSCIPDSHLGYLSSNLDRVFGSCKVWDRHLSCFFLLPHI